MQLTINSFHRDFYDEILSQAACVIFILNTQNHFQKLLFQLRLLQRLL